MSNTRFNQQSGNHQMTEYLTSKSNPSAATSASGLRAMASAKGQFMRRILSFFCSAK